MLVKFTVTTDPESLDLIGSEQACTYGKDLHDDWPITCVVELFGARDRKNIPRPLAFHPVAAQSNGHVGGDDTIWSGS